MNRLKSVTVYLPAGPEVFVASDDYDVVADLENHAVAVKYRDGRIVQYRGLPMKVEAQESVIATAKPALKLT